MHSLQVSLWSSCPWSFKLDIGNFEIFLSQGELVQPENPDRSVASSDSRVAPSDPQPAQHPDTQLLKAKLFSGRLFGQPLESSGTQFAVGIRIQLLMLSSVLACVSVQPEFPFFPGNVLLRPSLADTSQAIMNRQHSWSLIHP